MPGTDYGTLLMRCPPASDLTCWHNVIANEQYRWCVENAEGEVRNIVDLGANIGLASRYFIKHFPKATVWAVEPDESNYSVLELNVVEGIVPINAGIWSKQCRLSTNRNYRDCKEWATRTFEAEEGVRAITLTQLMEERDIEFIDILKVDIEGAEFELFKDTYPFDQVGMIAMEIHEDLGDKKQILSLLTDFGFEWGRVGELVVAKR